MTPDAFLTNTLSYPPICVGSTKLIWEEFDPNSLEDPPNRNRSTVRRVFYFRPEHSNRIVDGSTVLPAQVLPLIIWSHPNEATEVINPDNPYGMRVAQDAIDRGFAFMSLQYRHPTASQVDYVAPAAPDPLSGLNGASRPPGQIRESTDIAAAIQFARLHAERLHIDRDNIFLVGQSRGSLALLTAFMPNQRVPPPLAVGAEPYIEYSSKPNAVFAVQAQVTYDNAQLKSNFVKQYATTAVTNQIFAKAIQFPRCREDTTSGRFDYRCHFSKSVRAIDNTIGTPLSALDEFGQHEPPVWLRYDRKPASLSSVPLVGIYVNDAGTYQDNPRIDTNAENCYEDPLSEAAQKCIDVHHPNFGLKLYLKYQTFPGTRTSYMFVQYADTADADQRNAAGEKFFDDYYCLFMGYRGVDNVLRSNMRGN